MDFVYAELSSKQKAVFQEMKKLDFDFSALSLGDFARHCQVSENTVLNLCRKMGFAGYKELRLACKLDPALRLALAYKEISERDESLILLLGVCLSLSLPAQAEDDQLPSQICRYHLPL